jgi:hypothetical protein
MKEFFGEQFHPAINMGRNLLECEEKQIHRFKIIEIVSPLEIVEHMNFEHCYFANKRY